MKCLELSIPALPQFVTAGHSVWEPEEQHHERTFGLYDVIFVVSGKLHMTEGETQYDLNPGDVLILSPNTTHYGHQSSGETTELYWFHFLHREPARLLERDEIRWTSGVRRASSKDIEPPRQFMYVPKQARTDIKSFLPLLGQLVKLDRYLTVERSLAAHSLMIQVLSMLQYLVCRELSPEVRKVAEMAMGYLKRTVSQPFAAKRMEQELHFQYDYMTRCLKKVIGMTPVAYVQHLRVEEAKSLLQHTDLSVHAIGERVGVEDVNYFIRLFKKTEGMTPQTYRKTRRGYM